jgi:hypothetical protein
MLLAKTINHIIMIVQASGVSNEEDFIPNIFDLNTLQDLEYSTVQALVWVHLADSFTASPH